jgi:hypothetical protein
MHAIKLLHRQLKSACPTIHSKRLNTLICVTRTLSEDHTLSITGIGRAMKSSTSAKHAIKRVDRLVGNVWLQAERVQIYSAMTRWLLKRISQPVILIDWSDLTADREQQVLRASIPVGGRSITIYEEIHSIHKQANPKIHQRFLIQLKYILPRQVRPIIVTDAGFRGTWFKLVNTLGWHWVGRVRNRDFIQLGDEHEWHPGKDLYAFATRSPRRLGTGWLSRSKPNAAVFHVYKKAKQGRVAKSKLGQPIHNARHNKMAKRGREPWLIVTSPSLKHLTAKQVMSIYAKRMQIEEGFRDIKCERYGLGLSASLTKAAKRLETLLLIGALALFIIWMTGIAAIQQNIHHHFQSNTTRHRAVLSSIFTGMQIMRYNPGRFSKAQLLRTLSCLKEELSHAI